MTAEDEAFVLERIVAQTVDPLDARPRRPRALTALDALDRLDRQDPALPYPAAIEVEAQVRREVASRGVECSGRAQDQMLVGVRRHAVFAIEGGASTGDLRRPTRRWRRPYRAARRYARERGPRNGGHPTSERCRRRDPPRVAVADSSAGPPSGGARVGMEIEALAQGERLRIVAGELRQVDVVEARGVLEQVDQTDGVRFSPAVLELDLGCEVSHHVVEAESLLLLKHQHRQRRQALRDGPDPPEGRSVSHSAACYVGGTDPNRPVGRSRLDDRHARTGHTGLFEDRLDPCLELGAIRHRRLRPGRRGREQPQGGEHEAEGHLDRHPSMSSESVPLECHRGPRCRLSGRCSLGDQAAHELTRLRRRARRRGRLAPCASRGGSFARRDRAPPPPLRL